MCVLISLYGSLFVRPSVGRTISASCLWWPLRASPQPVMAFEGLSAASEALSAHMIIGCNMMLHFSLFRFFSFHFPVSILPRISLSSRTSPDTPFPHVRSAPEFRHIIFFRPLCSILSLSVFYGKIYGGSFPRIIGKKSNYYFDFLIFAWKQGIPFFSCERLRKLGPFRSRTGPQMKLTLKIFFIIPDLMRPCKTL